MDRYGRLNDESLNRLNYAQQQFINKRSNTIITCGWDYRKDSDLVIADVFKDYFLKNGMWPWSQDVINLYTDAINRNNFIRT